MSELDIYIYTGNDTETQRNETQIYCRQAEQRTAFYEFVRARCANGALSVPVRTARDCDGDEDCDGGGEDARAAAYAARAVRELDAAVVAVAKRALLSSPEPEPRAAGPLKEERCLASELAEPPRDQRGLAVTHTLLPRTPFRALSRERRPSPKRGHRSLSLSLSLLVGNARETQAQQLEELEFEALAALLSASCASVRSSSLEGSALEFVCACADQRTARRFYVEEFYASCFESGGDWRRVYDGECSGEPT